MGPDGISSFLVWDCVFIFAFSFGLILNLIIKRGCFPTKWKICKVLPVHKKKEIRNRKLKQKHSIFTVAFKNLSRFFIAYALNFYNHISSTGSSMYNGMVTNPLVPTNVWCSTRFYHRTSTIHLFYQRYRSKSQLLLLVYCRSFKTASQH